MKHTSKQIVFAPRLTAEHQYTCVATIGNSVYARARSKTGEPVYVEQKYLPTYYLPINKRDAAQATHWGYDGTPLIPHQCDNIWEAKQFVEQSKVPVWGNIQCEYMMLSDAYAGVDTSIYNQDLLYTWNIDIEVDSENGFAKPEDPFGEVTAITVIWRHMGKMGTVVYGCKPYTVKGDEFYVKCDNEHELLLRFLDDLRSGGDYPDIITGWYIQLFDIPYLLARCKKLFTEDIWIRLSPFSRLADRVSIINGRSSTVIDIKGIAILDYIEVYRKFTYSQQENYRLDTIASIELGERKLSFKELGSLHKLYQLDYQKFIEYNIQDVVLVDKLEQKKKLIELICALAYGAKANFVDCFKQVRLWDIMIYHKLRDEKKQIPPRKEQEKAEQYAGAFVKDPIVGMHKWVCSFDVASMYPHIIREWNLSPEMKYDEHVSTLTTLGKSADEVTAIVNALLERRIDTSPIKVKDYALAANGVLTNRHTEGFLPEMLKALYDQRIHYKKLQQKVEKEAEQTTDEAKKKELKKLANAYENQQKVRKVNLNSAYGAMGSQYFRFYDVALAEAVTVTGQMIIRWVARDINDYLNKLLALKHLGEPERDYIIASDTDSVYVRMEEIADIVNCQGVVSDEQIVEALHQFCDKKIQPIINKAFTDIADYLNVAVPCLTMVRDVICDKAVWTAKKRYIMNVWDSEGNRYKKPKVKVMGIEAIKSSTPSIVRKMITDSLQLFMTGSQNNLWEHITKCEKEFKSASFEDIAFPRGCNGLKKYEHREKGLPIQVAGALAYNRALERSGLTDTYEPIRDGEKVKFAYLREPNPFQSHVIAATVGCPAEWEIEKWLDYDVQFEKTFLSPMNNILECAGWSVEEEPALW